MAVKLSVIVLNWNGRHLLGDCLASLRVQTLRALDVLVVDNGSSDGSVEYLRREFPEVRVLPLDRNYGFCGGNNRGIESTTGEFVSLLNNDASAHPEWAERLLGAADEPRIGIVASRVLLEPDRTRLDSAGDRMTTAGVAYKRGHREPAGAYPYRELVFGASGCAMLLRRSMLEDIGLFDEDLFLLYEDGDLCFRAQLRGWKCRYEPKAVVYHKLSRSLGRLSRTRVYHGQRNVEWLYFKNMPGGLLWKHLPAHLLNDLLAWAYFSIKGFPLVFLKSKADFLLGLRRVLRKRREIQDRRTVSAWEIDSLLEKRWLRTRLAGK